MPLSPRARVSVSNHFLWLSAFPTFWDGEPDLHDLRCPRSAVPATGFPLIPLDGFPFRKRCGALHLLLDENETEG